MPFAISCVGRVRSFTYLYETPLDVSISTLFRSSTGRSSSLDFGLGATSSSSDVSLEEESASRVWLLSSLEKMAPPSESESSLSLAAFLYAEAMLVMSKSEDGGRSCSATFFLKLRKMIDVESWHAAELTATIS
jgi:hypothetical protein